MRKAADLVWPDVPFALADRLKALYWRDWKRRHGSAAGIRIADELRKQALAARPRRTLDEDRRRDEATHARVLAALTRVPARRSRSAR